MRRGRAGLLASSLESCALLLAVPSSNVARIQEIHILCLHVLAGRVEALVSQEER